MKKLLAMLLVCCLLLTLLCSCKDEEGKEEGSGADTSETQEILTGEFANDNEASYREAWKKSN